ncbi:hypothetical protein [Clostridium sp. HBUAS56010]|uniref:hypothetical protein n=1 Tax=Clostridium sp. HBUAS56010 TaxID=2571127 RepID=UPI00117814AE|nr:hypothetical protein [Clostridium sp. HBUAS56010]
MKAVKITGVELQELLKKSAGGIYVGRGFENFIKKSSIEVLDEELKLICDDCTTVTLPVYNGNIYVNFAVAAEDDTEDTVYEVWEGNAYFDYVFEILNTVIAFNINEKPFVLSPVQFKSLVEYVPVYGIEYNVSSVDSYGLSVDMNNCTLYVEIKKKEIEINTRRGAEVTIDMDIVDSIQNLTEEYGYVCYAIDLDGSARLEITPAKKFSFIGELRY